MWVPFEFFTVNLELNNAEDLLKERIREKTIICPWHYSNARLRYSSPNPAKGI